jgi:hypothetical protein
MTNLQMPTVRTIYPLEPADHISGGNAHHQRSYPLSPRPISWVDMALLTPIFGLMAFGLIWAIEMLAVI